MVSRVPKRQCQCRASGTQRLAQRSVPLRNTRNTSTLVNNIATAEGVAGTVRYCTLPSFTRQAPPCRAVCNGENNDPDPTRSTMHIQTLFGQGPFYQPNYYLGSITTHSMHWTASFKTDSVNNAEHVRIATSINTLTQFWRCDVPTTSDPMIAKQGHLLAWLERCVSATFRGWMGAIVMTLTRHLLATQCSSRSLALEA